MNSCMFCHHYRGRILRCDKGSTNKDNKDPKLRKNYINIDNLNGGCRRGAWEDARARPLILHPSYLALPLIFCPPPPSCASLILRPLILCFPYLAFHTVHLSYAPCLVPPLVLCPLSWRPIFCTPYFVPVFCACCLAPTPYLALPLSCKN